MRPALPLSSVARRYTHAFTPLSSALSAKPRLHSSPSSSSPSFSVFPSLFFRRGFASIKMPVDMSLSPDGVYRRPPVPMPRQPLSEDDELLWSDGTAPEASLDRFDHIIHPGRALALLLTALAVLLGGGIGLISLSDPANRQPTQPQVFPYDNLRVERGGPNGVPKQAQRS